MRAPLALPCGPVAIEQRCVGARLDHAVLLGVQTILVAGVVGTIGKNAAGEDQFLAVRRKQHAARFGGKVGDLPGVRSVGVHDPYLRRTCGTQPSAIRDECDLLGIGRPFGPFVVDTQHRDLAGTSAIHWNRIDLFGLGVLRQINGLNGERYGFAVGRKLRFLNARDLEQGLHVEGLLLGGEAQREQEQNAPGTRQRHHDSIVPQGPGKNAPFDIRGGLAQNAPIAGYRRALP